MYKIKAMFKLVVGFVIEIIMFRSRTHVWKMNILKQDPGFQIFKVRNEIWTENGP